jgi:hypothetical protein
MAVEEGPSLKGLFLPGFEIRTFVRYGLIEQYGFLDHLVQAFHRDVVYGMKQDAGNHLAVLEIEDALGIGQLVPSGKGKLKASFFLWTHIANPAIPVIKRDLIRDFALDAGLVHHQVMKQLHDLL